MYKDKTFLAIIPARGGSKRLPDKNILELNGKPLIAWSIHAALNSKYIDKIVVSSDSETIIDISHHLGAETLKRPDALAGDLATTFDTLKHVTEIYHSYDFIIVLQPTSPLRNEKHIDEAIELLMQKKADALVSVCQAEHNPLWYNILPEDNNLTHFLPPEVKNKASQELATYYRLNGAIYICENKRLITEQSLMIKDNIYAFKMDNENSVDIDTQMDLLYAEFLMKHGTVKLCN